MRLLSDLPSIALLIAVGWELKAFPRDVISFRPLPQRVRALQNRAGRRDHEDARNQWPAAPENQSRTRGRWQGNSSITWAFEIAAFAGLSGGGGILIGLAIAMGNIYFGNKNP